MCSHYSVAFIINLKEKKDIRKCNSKVLKTFSYFFFVDALNMKQIISPLFRVRRNRHWFCLVSLVSLKIKPLNLFSVLLWNYLIFENVVSDHEIQIKLNIVRNYLYYSVRDFFWLLSHGHLFHISLFNLFSFWEWVWKKNPLEFKCISISLPRTFLLFPFPLSNKGIGMATVWPTSGVPSSFLLLTTIIFACLSWLSIAPERWRTRL